MKKWKTLVVCIILVLCIVVGWIGMNNNSIHIDESYHSRTEACDISFDMWTAEADGIKYGFEKNSFSQNDVKGYFTEMQDYLHIIDKRLDGAESLSKNKNLEIYVLEDISQVDITKSRNTLILSKSEVENGEYKYPLFQYAYDLNGNSKNYGLFEYVNEENYDNDAIAEYLSKQDNQQVLDFFSARISDAFSDQDALDMYKQILSSFVTFTIQNNGIDGFLTNGFSKDQVVKWGDSIGITLRANDDADNTQEWFFMRDNAHEFHIQYENTTFYSGSVVKTKI